MKKRKTREEHLATLRQDVDGAWAEVERLYRAKKDSPALRLLLDLAEVAAALRSESDFLERVRHLDSSNPQRQLKRVGVPARGTRTLGSSPGTDGTQSATEDFPSKKKRRTRTAEDQDWIKARKLCGLNKATVAKARALGMRPRALIENRPSPSQPWKAPVRVWIEELYARRFANSDTGEPTTARTQLTHEPWDDIPF